AGRGMVPRRVEHMRVLRSKGRAGSDSTSCADLEPPFPGRRVPATLGPDRGPVGRARAGAVHAGAATAVSRLPAAGGGVERAPLHGLQLRAAGGARKAGRRGPVTAFSGSGPRPAAALDRLYPRALRISGRRDSCYNIIYLTVTSARPVW